MSNLNIEAAKIAIDKPIGFKTENKASKERNCLHCETDISHRSHLAKYCSDPCRINSYEKRTGKKFVKGQKR